MEDIIIRQENFGTLLYSKKYRSYFIPKDKKVEEKLQKRIHQEQIGEESNSELDTELEKLGFGKKKKYIISQNEKGLMAPLEYYFDFTNVCNLRCTHCYNRENMNQATMEKEKIKKIIKDMYENGIMRLHLAGGEPTLFPEQLDIYMGTAKKYGIMTSMSSNGTHITEEICNILEKNKVSSITISLESATEERNAKIRGKGNLAKAIEGIKTLVDYRDSHQASFIITIKISYDTQMPKEEFEKLIQLGIDLKVNMVKFANPERCIFHEQGFYEKVADSYYKTIKMIHELKEKYQDKIIITEVSSPVNQCDTVGLPNMKGCIGAQELIAIGADGQLNPCLMNPYDLGNMDDYDSISDLYQSDTIKEYWKKIKAYSCSSCRNHSQCRGGCQVRKIVQTGSIQGKDPLCPQSRKIKPIEQKDKEKEFQYFEKVVVAHSL